MTLLREGRSLYLQGYGRLTGETEQVTVKQLTPERVLLVFRDGADEYEVPFQRADGYAVGSTREGGFRIPPEVMEKGKKIMAATATAAETPTRKKASTATAETPKRRGRPPGSGKKAVEAAIESATASAKPSTAAKSNGKTAAPETSGDPSPMELEAAARKSPKDGEVEVGLSPLMFRQLVWNQIRPYPTGRRMPGYKEFRAAFSKPVERSYVFVNVGEVAARYLVQTAFREGFDSHWSGALTGPFKRASKRISGELAEKFGFEVPDVITNHAGGRETPRATGARRGRPPGTGKNQRAAAETKTASTPAKPKSKKSAETASTPTPAKRRGRPPGSVNRVVPEPTPEVAATAKPSTARKVKKKTRKVVKTAG